MGTLDGLRSTAKAIVDTFGTSVTLTSHTTLTYTVSTGVPGATTSTTAVKGVVDMYRWHERTPMIRETDLKLTVAASDLSGRPTLYDTVTIDSRIYRIVDYVEVRGTDQAVIYEVQLRYDG